MRLPLFRRPSGVQFEASERPGELLSHDLGKGSLQISLLAESDVLADRREMAKWRNDVVGNTLGCHSPMSASERARQFLAR